MVGATGFEPVTSSVSDPTSHYGRERRMVEIGEDHQRTAGERRCQCPNRRMIRNASAGIMVVPTAVGCCPSAARGRSYTLGPRADRSPFLRGVHRDEDRATDRAETGGPRSEEPPCSLSMNYTTVLRTYGRLAIHTIIKGC
jgi:hypothetical protein